MPVIKATYPRREPGIRPQRGAGPVALHRESGEINQYIQHVMEILSTACLISAWLAPGLGENLRPKTFLTTSKGKGIKNILPNRL